MTYEEAIKEAGLSARATGKHAVVCRWREESGYYKSGWTLDSMGKDADIRAVVLPNGRILEAIGARVREDGSVQA
jgi:hypothetical protein